MHISLQLKQRKFEYVQDKSTENISETEEKSYSRYFGNKNFRNSKSNEGLTLY